MRVVFPAPHLRLHLRLAQSQEYLHVQTLVAHLRIETLDETVLPGTARVDMQRVRAALMEPVFQLLRDEFRAIVRADKGRISVLIEQIVVTP